MLNKCQQVDVKNLVIMTHWCCDNSNKETSYNYITYNYEITWQSLGIGKCRLS